MSEGGERMCPLCAEEMDLTDQHLKPCKCGYEICVWCWHHIIDMAEKDETEGRCPACRTPYNKEKIVGTTANCEKLVSEMNVEKKLKSHKGKSKTSEGRKQLGSVRVIQRNLVYVVGLPLNFADENLLQRKEYFGQYGKVLKVSISRTTTGAIQHFANSTCSVYITYSKEEEAIRCIQSVNGFILDGRPLRACFGTTKYCHAWLRNTPCSNPDCLYLHEIGSQEDSFTKDEVISAYTRSRVQQITGATNSMQHRSGNVLPSPADEYFNNGSAPSGKLINKTATNTNQISAGSAGVSPPNSSSGRSAALPAGASWGTRSSNNQPLSTITPCSNWPLKHDSYNGSVASSIEVASVILISSLQTGAGKKIVPIEENSTSLDKMKLENLVPAKQETKTDSITELKNSSTSLHPMTSPSNRQLHGVDTTMPPHNLSKKVDSFGPTLHNNSTDGSDGIIENICSDFLSMGIHNNSEQIKEPENSEAPGRSANMSNAVSATDGLSDFGLGIPTQLTQVDLCETEDDLLSFDNQRLKDPEVTASINLLPDIFNSFHMPNHSSVPSVLNIADGSASVGLGGQAVDKDNSTVSASNFPLMSGGHPYIRLNSLDVNDVEYSNLFPSKDKMSLLGRYEGEVGIGAGNMGENSIISNILSMDFESFDESLTSPQKLAQFFGETDKLRGSFGVSGSWKIQSSSQSRFSFAREDTMNQATHFVPSNDFLEKDFKQHPHPFDNDFPNSNSMHLDNDKFAPRNNYPFLGAAESDVFTNNHSNISDCKLSVSRSQISAPPGFSAPNRTPPPGFTSYEKADQILGTLSGSHMLDTSSFSRNQWQSSQSSNTFSNCDIEFMDPAILEVRHGTHPGGINSPVLDVRSSYSPQLSTYEEARLQSFLQRSLPPHTNQRINELGNGFSSIVDAYGVRSRVMEQTLPNNFSQFSQFTHPQPRNAIASNGQWNGWNEGPGGNNLGMAEFLRNERLGFNKLYGGYEDSNLGMPSSANMYDGTYGI